MSPFAIGSPWPMSFPVKSNKLPEECSLRGAFTIVFSMLGSFGQLILFGFHLHSCSVVSHFGFHSFIDADVVFSSGIGPLTFRAMITALDVYRSVPKSLSYSTFNQSYL